MASRASARSAPSARLEAQIVALLREGLGDAGEHLSELGRLSASDSRASAGSPSDGEGARRPRC